MKLSYYWKLIRGKTAALNPAKFDIKHIWAVFQSWVRSLFPVPEHIKQQIAWREYMVKTNSPKCWEEGHCIQCGCVIKEKIKSDMGCENEPFCYPEMMSKKAWKKYKESEDFFKVYKKPTDVNSKG